MDIVWEIRERCLAVDWVLFAITGWSLWSNRNKLKHDGSGKTVAEMVRFIVEYAKKVRQSHQVNPRPPNSGMLSWTPPSLG